MLDTSINISYKKGDEINHHLITLYNFFHIDTNQHNEV